MTESTGPVGGERLAVRLAANSIVQIGGSALAAAISFFTFVAMTRGLGPEAYGDYVAATSFLFLPIVLSDLGLATTVLRDISARPQDTEAVMRRSVPLRAGLSAVAVAVMVLFGLLIPFGEQTKVAILIWSVGAWATLMNVAVLPVLQAQLRMHWAVTANVVGRTVSLVLTLGALEADLGFSGVVWAQVIGVVVTFLVDLAVVGRLVPLRPIVDVPYWRTLVRSSIVIGLAIGLGQVFFKVDGVILALVRPAEEVGFYGAAYKFLEVADLIVAAIALSVFPMLTHYVATGSPNFRPLVQRTFDILLAAATAVSLVFLLFAEQLVVVSSGQEFEAGADALRLLAPYPMLFFVNALMWRVLIAAQHDRVLLKIAASVLTLNIALNVALLPPFGFRAAAVTAVVSEIVSITVSAIVLRRRMGFLPSVAYGWVIGLAALAMAAVALLLPGPWPLAAAAGLVAYGLVLVVLPGTAREGLAQVRRELRPVVAEPDQPAVETLPALGPLPAGEVELSVVIPARNAASTIGAQLESLANQDWTGSWEVVIVDNGSTDDTASVVEQFVERLPAVRIVSARGRNSIPYARNRGVEAARGRLIAFCDADDEVGEGWLAAVAAGLERYGAVGTPRDHVRLNEAWVRASREPPPANAFHENWYPPYLPHTAAGGMAVRRELHEAIGGFDESLSSCEDNDYCFRLQLRGVELGTVQGAVYHYRFRDTIGGIFRQAYWYSEQNARVQRMYRTPDAQPPRRWTWPVKNWPALLGALPGVIRKGGRARFAWLLGWELGRLRGSIRHRVLAV